MAIKEAYEEISICQTDAEATPAWHEERRDSSLLSE